MAINVTLGQVSTLNNTSILAQTNANSAILTTALVDAVSRSGGSPNQMQSPLDMNSNPILNLPPASLGSEPVILSQIAGTNLPVGFPTLTGDVTGTVNTSTGTVPTTLATVNAGPGTTGSSTVIPVVTVNGKGLTTSVTTATVNPTQINGVAYPASPSTNTIPVVTSSNTVSYDTGTQVTALLTPFTSGNQGVVPASGGGTSNFLRADATFAAPTASGSLAAVNYYTTSQTITIPAATKALVTLVGGGGGGGGATAGATNEFVFPGNGGGGGGLVKFLTGLTAGNTFVLTIGTAGGGGAAGANNGTAGGSTTLASGTQTITTLTAGGGNFGAGATGNASNTVYGTQGAGGTSTNGDVNVTGSPGFSGGQSAFGFGGPGNFTNTITSANGVAGVGFGGGGLGGSISGVVANVSGGAGTAGICQIEWYS